MMSHSITALQSG